jgi:hypothetical protein
MACNSCGGTKFPIKTIQPQKLSTLRVRKQTPIKPQKIRSGRVNMKVSRSAQQIDRHRA